MKPYENFWVVTIIRGLLALTIASAILIVPDMARTILFLPFAYAFVILSLVAYGVADSLLVFVSSFFTHIHGARTALRLQSIAGVLMGALFFSILFDRIQLDWFLYLIALQAFATAFAEFATARHTSVRHGSVVAYAAGAVALLCSVVYMMAGTVASAALTPREIATVAYAYLAAFGLAQSLMAARMLYLEAHPAKHAPLGQHIPASRSM